LLRIENIYTTYHVIKLLDRREFEKININALIEKWMSCDALWVPRKKKGEYCLRTKENENYSSKKYGKLCYYLLYLFHLNKKNITKNMKDRKSTRYTFMETHDGQEEKLRTS
jgi:hypothetical protein